jgi:hypothetical protein
MLPIAALFARKATDDLARSALPDAPQLPVDDPPRLAASTARPRRAPALCHGADRLEHRRVTA